MNDPKFKRARDYVVEALAGFRNDPADSSFQQGYEAALNDVLREAFDWPTDTPVPANKKSRFTN